MEEKPKRRWFQFRLRTLLIVFVVLSGPLAWVSHSLNWIRERHNALAMLSDLERYFMMAVPPKEEPAAPGLLWVFGEQGFHFAFWQLRDYRGPPSVEEMNRLFP